MNRVHQVEQASGRVLLAGIHAGEFRPNMDIDAVIDQIYGAIYYWVLLGLGTLNSSYMGTFVRERYGRSWPGGCGGNLSSNDQDA
jgi:hypothetical protein